MDLHYLPIITTIFSVVFAIELYRRYAGKPTSYHLLWWAIGVTTYGMGTLTESLITLTGWSELLFRTWYIVGALLGGAPLAQGTVYLVMKKRTAHVLSTLLVIAVLFGSTAVILTPLNYSLVNPHLPQGDVIVWQWVRMISPFINSYAFIFLVGGAIASAVKFRSIPTMRNRFIGNCFIAIGAILPGIGGAMSRMGHTQVLYVAELIGLVLIYVGYRSCIKAPAPLQHPLQANPEYSVE